MSKALQYQIAGEIVPCDEHSKRDKVLKAPMISVAGERSAAGEIEVLTSTNFEKSKWIDAVVTKSPPHFDSCQNATFTRPEKKFLQKENVKTVGKTAGPFPDLARCDGLNVFGTFFKDSRDCGK